MRTDLGWTYLLAGSMNTGNALGYFFGALLTPVLMRRLGIWQTLVGGSVLVGVFMLLSGIVTDAPTLFLLRVCAGVASAFVFVGGGVLAAQLGSMHSKRAGLLIGLYYGGTGLGIAASALLVPAALAAAQQHGVAHSWQWPWLVLGIACLVATGILAGPAKAIGGAPLGQTHRSRFVIGDFLFGLSGYFMFGVGYIGYMTFVVALLRQQGMSAGHITLFYIVAWSRGRRVAAPLGPHAGSFQRWRAVGNPQWHIRSGLDPTGPDLGNTDRLSFRGRLRCGVSFRRGIDDRSRAAQLAARDLVLRDQRVHRRLRFRADRRAYNCRLDRRRPGRPRTRIDRVGDCAICRRGARRPTKAAGAGAIS